MNVDASSANVVLAADFVTDRLRDMILSGAVDLGVQLKLQHTQPALPF